MKDSFTIYNASGAQSATGYSMMEMADPDLVGLETYNPKSAMVTHGFPNLTYNDTRSIRSDPEITIYHDSIAVTDSSADKLLWILIPVAAGIAAVGIAVLLKRRRVRGPG